MNDGTDEEGKLILALDVGGTKIAGSVLRFSSGHMPELIRLVQEPTQAQEGGLAVLQRIVEFSCELLGRIDREVMGIGIGAAGVIALDGSIESATSLMPGWSGMPLGPALRATTGTTVSVVGDVHAHALGEAHWRSCSAWCPQRWRSHRTCVPSGCSPHQVFVRPVRACGTDCLRTGHRTLLPQAQR